MQHNSIRIRGSGLARAAAAALFAAPAAAYAAWEWNLQTPVSAIARQLYELHAFIFWICAVIFVALFGVMF